MNRAEYKIFVLKNMQVEIYTGKVSTFSFCLFKLALNYISKLDAENVRK